MPTIRKGRQEEEGKIIFLLETKGASPCPSCGVSNVVRFGKRIQSVADVPESGRPVVLRVITRRFREIAADTG